MNSFDRDFNDAVEKAKKCTPEDLEELIARAKMNMEVQLLGRIKHNERTIFATRDLCERAGINYSEPEKYLPFLKAIAYYLAVREIKL